MSNFISQYKANEAERAKEGVPPLALNANDVKEVVAILESSDESNKAFAKDLLTNRVSPGVDDGAKIKAEFLGDLVNGSKKCSVLSPEEAAKLLGTMLGGYNVPFLIKGIESSNASVAKECANALKNTLLVYDGFDKVAELSKSNALAKEIIESWANAEWFNNRADLPEEIKLVVFKVDGETNTEDRKSVV